MQRLAPLGAGRQREAERTVVQPPLEARNGNKHVFTSSPWMERTTADLALDVGKDFASPCVDAQKPRCRYESRLLEVIQIRLNRRALWVDRTLHRVTDADNALGHVPAQQRFFGQSRNRLDIDVAAHRPGHSDERAAVRFASCAAGVSFESFRYRRRHAENVRKLHQEWSVGARSPGA